MSETEQNAQLMMMVMKTPKKAFFGGLLGGILGAILGALLMCLLHCFDK